MHLMFLARSDTHQTDFFKAKKIKDPKNLKKCVELAKNKCQVCGSHISVSAHHIKFRSEGGDNSLGNLIALCFNCHRKAHDGINIGDDYLSARDFMLIALELLKSNRYEKAIIELRKKKK